MSLLSDLDEKHNNLPSDITVEFALIGWILSDNKVMTVIGDLTAEDFYSAPHCDIFQAIERLYREGKQITPFTIKPYVKNLESFEISGGIYKYLAGSLSQSLLMPYPSDQAKYLLELSRKRQLLVVCESVATGDASSPVEEQAEQLIKTIGKVTAKSLKAKLLDNYQVTEQILNDLKDERKPSSTGIAVLDDAMGGGLFLGKSYGFAARKKVGKTALAATLSANLNRSGVKHLFICGEMSAKEIHQRVLAREVDVFPSVFKNDKGKSIEFGNKLADFAVSAPRNMVYADAPGLTFDELRALVVNCIETHKISGFILDYWQLVGGKIKNQSTAEHLDDVAQWIADIGRKYGIWSITMAQINQEGNTRGGEGIRLAFDQVYQIHREDLSMPETWVEMMETRYTQWKNLGSKDSPKLRMMEKGTYFEQIGL